MKGHTVKYCDVSVFKTLEICPYWYCDQSVNNKYKKEIFLIKDRPPVVPTPKLPLVAMINVDMSAISIIEEEI